MSAAGQIDVVTDAAGNLGRAVAPAFAAKGARPVPIDWSFDALTAVFGGQSTTM